jgi:hypothetical protein
VYGAKRILRGSAHVVICEAYLSRASILRIRKGSVADWWQIYLVYIIMQPSIMSIPFFPYKLFFLYVEPVSALAGAYYAALKPAEYLQDLTMSPSINNSNPILSIPMSMSLAQLANLYLLFALNEHLVLSSTSSPTVWRRLLFCLLLADFGHLATMIPLGLDVFWKAWEWNAMVWGSVGFVYLGASMRISFLLGLGLNNGPTSERAHGNNARKER